MSHDRHWYRIYKALSVPGKEYTLVEILNKYCTAPVSSENWSQQDTEIILGLHEAELLVDKIVSLSVDPEHGDPKKRPLSEPNNPTVIHPQLVTFKQDLVKGSESETIKALYELEKYFQNNPVNQFGERQPRQPKKNKPDCLAVVKYLLWDKPNYSQRTALYIFTPLAITSAIFGAVTAKSTALTTVGTTLAKILPQFITAFGTAHAIPPAALAFYFLAGTLAVTALILFFASTLNRCRTAHSKNPSTHLTPLSKEPHDFTFQKF